MGMVRPLYEEIAAQMKGLYWKDGGPVIGIQVDNECSNLPYLLALKEMAKSCGVDVPFYTMTGWNGAKIPTKDLLPLFGAYSDGFWGGGIEKFRKSFEFTEVRDDGDLGAQIVNSHPDRSNNIVRFPYSCCEIGAGMMSSDARRIKIVPAEIAAMALVKLGSGNNMPGYYMYQGGMNPEGKLGSLEHLEEDHPNVMPVKDYDFQAPLGACGEEREQYGLLREQHLFLEDFGGGEGGMALMPAMFPEVRPKDLKDFSTVRWSVRSDGERGFLFFNNEQPLAALPGHEGVQFAVKMKGGVMMVPREPVTIPSGSFGMWPLNMDCDGVKVRYATVQPLCRMREGGDSYYFFAAVEGIEPEFCVEEPAGIMGGAVSGTVARKVKAGMGLAVKVVKGDKSVVNFVVLTAEQARHLSRQEFAGRERLVECEGTVFADGGELRVESEVGAAVGSVSIFPGVKEVQVGGETVAGVADGIFEKYAVGTGGNELVAGWGVELEKPGTVGKGEFRADSEEAWKHASVWKLTNLPAGSNGRILLQIQYVGDALRIYNGDTLIDDNFFNGDSFDLGLWRIPAGEWGALRIKVLPISQKIWQRVTEGVRARYEKDGALPEDETVKVTGVEMGEVRVGVR